MRTLLLFSFIFFTSPIHAQPLIIEWQKMLGGYNDEEAHSIVQTQDGGYAITGHSFSNDGDVSGNNGEADFWVVKLFANGTIEWEKNYGGSYHDFSSEIIQSTDGGYVVVGGTGSTDGDVENNPGGSHGWVLKLNNQGEIEWQKVYGDNIISSMASVQQTIDGGYIIGGSIRNFVEPGEVNYGANGWVIKTDENGNIEWEKSLGGTGQETINCIRQTSDGGYIAAGKTSSTDGGLSSNGSDDYWIVKLDASGDIEWQKSMGGSLYDRATSVAQAKDGGYIVAGYAFSEDGDVSINYGNIDCWVIKLDAHGELQWERNYGGSDFDTAAEIQTTDDGGYLMFGTTISNDLDVNSNNGAPSSYWLVKLNSDGDIQWEKTYGGSCCWSNPHSFDQTSDGGVVLAGYFSSFDEQIVINHGGTDYLIIKLLPNRGRSEEDAESYISSVRDAQEFASPYIFPNPVNTTLNIEGLYPAVEIIITNVMGEVLYKSMALSNSETIDVSRFPAGVYFLNKHHKFIKE